MAQATDYEILTADANTGTSYRAAVNAIFGAIVTNNSGSTAPTTTYAFMRWVDTSNASTYYLKQRNHDNTAWVSLLAYDVATKTISAVNTPAGNISSTTMQGAINELDSEKVAKITSTANKLVKFSDTSSTITNSVIHDDGTNIGMSTSSPVNNLTIGAARTFSVNADANSGYIGTNFDSSYNYITSSKYAIRQYFDSSTGNWDLSVTQNTGTAGSPATFTTSVRVNKDGNVTIPTYYSSTTASAANCYVDSTGRIFRSTSARKYKTNIENIDSSYVNTFFNNARPIYYKSLSENDNPNWGYWGFIAEEIAEFDKRLVHWRYDTKQVEVEKERVIPAVEAVKDEDGKIIQKAQKEKIEKYTEIETVNDTEAPMIAEGVQYERVVVLLTAKIQELEARLKVLESK